MQRGIKKGPRMINEIKRLEGLGLSQVKISLALAISRGTVRKYLKDIINENKQDMVQSFSAPWSERIDWQHVHEQTNRGWALSHYHEEYIANAHPDIVYVSFWREFKRRYPNIPIQYHKSHAPGERCEVDYKGDAAGLGYLDPISGQYIQCRLFGAVLCFSQLFFARATVSEKQGDLLESLGLSYEYFGGVPLTTAVDNAKALVNKAHRYDPELNPEFIYFAEHFATAPLAMRPGKPKDKNLIENVLGVFWRWLRARIKQKVFRSLGELNRYLIYQLDIFNNRIQKKYGSSRRQKHLGVEKNTLLPLPEKLYFSGEWRQLKVHPDSHVQALNNFYSVPYQQIGKEVAVRISTGFVEIFGGLERLTIHNRLSSSSRGRYVTQSGHLPPIHHELNIITPAYLTDKAASIGPATKAVVERLFTEAQHPLMYLRRVQGILRLERRYSKERLEKSCVFFQHRSLAELKLNNIETIINNPLETEPSKEIIRQNNPNLRGQSHWSSSNIH